jgi:glycine C-acetyltransferase
MSFTLKDFSIETLPTDVVDRAEQFKKYIAQAAQGTPACWAESVTAVKPEMILKVENSDETQKVYSFISNDYLGMSQHPETKKAGIEAVEKYGTGSCASPMIGGYLSIQRQLEEEIAKFTGQEDALVFSSGFGVNVGVLNALLGKDDIAFVDLQAHRSVLDGLFNTNTKKIGHNNVEYLEFALEKERHKYKTAMVIIDGIYSQDGDMAPLPEIVALCKKYNAMLYLDDAHGLGVMGKTGRGVAEHFDLLGQIDIITGTLSKSFGTVGGFIACSKALTDYLKFYANTSIFSASPTPQTICSVQKAIELIQADSQYIKKLWDNVHYLRKRFTDEGFDIKQTVSPIFPVMIRDPHKTAEAIHLLRQHGIYACGVGFPAVTDKESRVRVSISASHERKHLDALVNAFCEIDKQLHIRKKQ